MNTRRFHRTTAQAFKGPDYACAIERPPARRRFPLKFAIAAMLLAAIAIGCSR